MATSAKKTKPAVKKSKAASKVPLEELRRFVRTKATQLLRDNTNITSVGIGYKEKDGKPTKELAIQFTVASKVVPESLDAIGSAPIPSTIDVNGIPVPTDVLERTFKPQFTEVNLHERDVRKTRVQTMVPGVSVGGQFTKGGTLGTFVKDRTNGRLVLLSNWHVLEGPSGSLGNAVVQPGAHDDNRLELNVVGKVLRSHLGAAGDCAIASCDGRPLSNEILELGVVASSIGDPEIGDRVVKSGRTTGVTRGKVKRVEVNTPMQYGPRLAVVGGFEIEIDPKAVPPSNELSRGGDSGSAWMAIGSNGKPTSVMLGLHFGGDADGMFEEVALACYAESVMQVLDLEPLGAIVPQDLSGNVDRETPGLGFDRNFLDFAVPPPTFTYTRKEDLAELDGDIELRYRHFSSWLSKTRKYPLCVAWNIDGSTFKKLKRTSFRLDRRGDLEDYQLTNAIYEHNPFDRGHLARRADLCWGSIEEAREANRDSFFHTNIAPQHEAFNQSGNVDDDPEGGVWGRLENTILDSEHPHELKVSLMAGPVFGKKDRAFAQGGEVCLLPDEFWKVVIYKDDEDGSERVYGFLLTQRHLLPESIAPEGLDFESWLWARATLKSLQDKTGVRFPAAMRAREVKFIVPQALDAPGIKVMRGPKDYFA